MSHFINMSHPGILCFHMWFDAGAMQFLHVVKTVSDPFDMLFDGDSHIAKNRGAAGTGDDEKIREASSHQTQVGARTSHPFLLERLTVFTSNIHFEEGACHGIKTGCK